jgi:hypothetical protein
MGKSQGTASMASQHAIQALCQAGETINLYIYQYLISWSKFFEELSPHAKFAIRSFLEL